MLDWADLTLSVPEDRYREELKLRQAEVRRMQCMAFASGVPVVVVFEGWDAAGKGGGIKRLTDSMDPRRYTVVPVGVPTPAEQSRHYLWRFWQQLPAAGHLTVFDRSWYGRVLVERVEGLCTRAEWERAYDEINSMESQVAGNGAAMAKIWLHIDRDTQLRRFEERERDPDKRWKITEDDWRNRSRWDDYYAAVDEMLRRTSTRHAPWTIIESNDKNHSRIKTIETVIEAIRAKVEHPDR